MSAVEEPSRQTITSVRRLSQGRKQYLPMGTSETEGREGAVEVQCVLEPGGPAQWEAMPPADRWENHGFSSSWSSHFSCLSLTGTGKIKWENCRVSLVRYSSRISELLTQ